MHRSLQLKRPICFYDLESTGVNVFEDRIVSISIIKLFPDGSRKSFYSLVNPGIQISKESSDIHGITNEMVKDSLGFSQISNEILSWFKDSDLAGYNIDRFDIPLLSIEFQREKINFPESSDIKIVDAATIYMKLNPRTLSAAYERYTGTKLEGAHNAEFDNNATIKVLEGELREHKELPVTVEELALYCSDGLDRVDIQRKFARNKEGDIVLNFGKLRGQKAKENPDYLRWMISKDFHYDTINWCNNILQELENKDQMDLPF